MNWISTKDRLPQINQRVIAYLDEDAVHVIVGGERVRVVAVNYCACYGGGNNQRPFEWSDGPMRHFFQDVTHWMPIPEAPDPPIEAAERSKSAADLDIEAKAAVYRDKIQATRLESVGSTMKRYL